jgi:hypothetical protein
MRMKRILMSWCLLLVATGAGAHGGLSMEQDMCKLTVGPYMMHFAGYQEDAQRTEFCEDIPHKGPTIIVLDVIDLALRDLPIEFRIVRKTDGPLDAAPEVYKLAPAVYPKGTLMIRHDFMDDGDYVGLVYAGADRKHASVFPFSVGKPSGGYWKYTLGLVGLLLLALFGLQVGRQRLQKDIAMQGQNEA